MMPASYTMYYNNGGHSANDWRQAVFEAVASHLTASGYDVRIVIRRDFGLRLLGVFPKTLFIRDSLALIQDNATRAFHVLDCHDWPDPDDIELLVRDPRCQQVLKCQYADEPLDARRYRRLRPWTYFEGHWPTNQNHLIALRGQPRHEHQLYFRGNLVEERRPIVSALQQRGVLNPEGHHVAFEVYCTEVSRHRLMLSLPGMGEICHRDIEGFAAGTPVLRPWLPNRFHDNLEPDHHYISADTNIEHDEPEVAIARIEERYRQVIDDQEFLAFVTRNAAAWYDRNVRLPASMALTEALLDLPR